MASKKEEVANMLIAAAFDTSLKKLNSVTSKGLKLIQKQLQLLSKLVWK